VGVGVLVEDSLEEDSLDEDTLDEDSLEEDKLDEDSLDEDEPGVEVDSWDTILVLTNVNMRSKETM
jgi:hypothetical protein